MAPPSVLLLSTSSPQRRGDTSSSAVPWNTWTGAYGRYWSSNWPLQPAGRIKRQRGTKSRPRAARGTGLHGGERRAAAIRPTLQPDPVRGHVGAGAQIGERPVSIERAHGHLVEFGGTGFIAEARKPLRMAGAGRSCRPAAHHSTAP